MKKTKYFVVGALALSVGVLKTYAAPTHSISVNRGTIENGQSVNATVTVRNAASWHVVINGTGNTNGCSLNEADATSSGKNATKNFTVTCKSNSTGMIKINYSGDATSEDGSTVNLSGSKTVTVVAPTPKSTNNYLSALGIEGGLITPDFNKDTLEYTVTVEAGTEKVIINAEKADAKASISGAGEQTVVEGENKFPIVVTAENGSQRTYTLTVIVKEFDPIYVKVDGTKYTLVRKLEELKKPENYVESTVTIDDNVIPALVNEKAGKTLVGLKDEAGNIYLFEYKDGKYERYIEFTFKSLSLNIIKMDRKLIPKYYKEYEVKLFDNTITAYKLSKNSRYAIVYAVNLETGDKELYQIDLIGKTAQEYNEELMDKLTDTEKQNKKMMLIISGIFGGVMLIELFALVLSRKKKNKILDKIKENEMNKVRKEAIKDAKKDTLEENENKIVEKETPIKEESLKEEKVSKVKKSKK